MSEENKELGMASITKQARVRKRNSDKKQNKATVLCLGVCLFSMGFVLIMKSSKQESMKIVVLDPAGNTYDAEAVPFEGSKKYHEHLMNLAIGGIYARDENGAMNNNLEMFGTVEVIRQRDEMYADQDRLFKDKRIVQYPRVVGYLVDVVSSKKMIVKAKIQVIRDAFTLAGSNVKGLQNVNLLLEFEANEDLGDSKFTPWKLSKFTEVDVEEKGDK